ncbi:hypothetical protein ACFQZZ_19585 [Nocardia sp. GCM10030253]|uniref:DUF7691 family protein n=1 Tax=Nocardia sp. GCM10030253 TaxID=3273404 RepID=UPI00363A13F6
MGYFLSLYIVDLDTVAGVVGSKDDGHFERISVECAAAMAQLDEDYAEHIADGAPTAVQALRTVIDGGPFDQRYANDYLDVYESMCSVLGAELDNLWGPLDFGWPARVDKGLAALGMRVSVRAFAGNRLPAGLPHPTQAGCGEWTERDCLAALDRWTATLPEQRAALEPDVLEGIEDCVAWMQEVKRFPGTSIVGFWG